MTIYRCTLCSHRFAVEDPKNVHCPQCKIEGELHSNDMLTERVAERDREIAELRRQLASLRPSPPPDHGGGESGMMLQVVPGSARCAACGASLPDNQWHYDIDTGHFTCPRLVPHPSGKWEHKNTPGDGSAGASSGSEGMAGAAGSTPASAPVVSRSAPSGPGASLTLADAVPCGCNGALELVETEIARKCQRHVSCSCGIMGPSADSVHDCVSAWNRAMSHPPRGPLTEAEVAFCAFWTDSDGNELMSTIPHVANLLSELRSRRDDPTVELRYSIDEIIEWLEFNASEWERRRMQGMYQGERDKDNAARIRAIEGRWLASCASWDLRCRSAKRALDAAKGGA